MLKISSLFKEIDDKIKESTTLLRKFNPDKPWVIWANSNGDVIELRDDPVKNQKEGWELMKLKGFTLQKQLPIPTKALKLAPLELFFNGQKLTMTKLIKHLRSLS